MKENMTIETPLEEQEIIFASKIPLASSEKVQP